MTHPTQCDTIMEAIVRAITLVREKRQSMDDDPDEIERKRALLARHWVIVERPGHAGRLLPDTELQNTENALERLVHQPTYEAYLRARGQAVGRRQAHDCREHSTRPRTRP